MHEYAPQATLLLVVLVPLLEPVGWTAEPEADTLLNYHFTPVATAAILVSAVLGSNPVQRRVFLTPHFVVLPP
jgi:hypothetical protein